MSDHGQVQLRLPVQPPASPTPHTPACRSTASHLSLRRFAHNYVFGAASRIGSTCSHPSSEPSSHESPPPSFPTSSETVSFADLASSSSTSQHAQATEGSPPLSQGGNTSPCRRPRSNNFFSSSTLRHASSSHLSVNPENQSSSSTALPPLVVRKRPTERCSVPKRYREEISVDALTLKFESLLGSGTPSWKSRAISKSGRSLSAKKALKTSKAFVAAFGELNIERPANTDGEIIETVGEDRREVVDKLEDQDIDDELSFLINKFELDGKDKQTIFMPYIT